MSEAIRTSKNYSFSLGDFDFGCGIVNQLSRAVLIDREWGPRVFSQRKLAYDGRVEDNTEVLLRVVLVQPVSGEGQYDTASRPTIEEVFGVPFPTVATEVLPSWIKISDRHFFGTCYFSHRHRLSHSISYQVPSVGSDFLVVNGAIYLVAIADKPCTVRLWSRVEGTIGTIGRMFG